MCAAGKVWAPQSCVLVTPSGKLPSVESRGEELNGTAYASLGSSGSGGSGNGSSSGSSSSDDSGSSLRSGSGGCGGGSGTSSSEADGGRAFSINASALAEARGVTLLHDPNPDWLQYGGTQYACGRPQYTKPPAVAPAISLTASAWCEHISRGLTGCWVFHTFH